MTTKAKPKPATPATKKEDELNSEEIEKLEALRPVSSAMLSDVAYSPENKELEVVFVNGDEESYDCDLSLFEGLLKAPSIGKYMWSYFL